MPDRFNRPTDPAGALYHDLLCGNVELVQQTVHACPELVRDKAVVNGAWSHGGRRCAAEDDVIARVWLVILLA